MATSEHAKLLPALSAATVADIEGLNPDTAGFCRPECCSDELPADLAGSFGNLKLHVLVGTNVPPTQWDKHAHGIAGYGGVTQKMKGATDAKVTLYYSPDAEAAPQLVFQGGKGPDAGLGMVEYTGVPNGELPFDAKGAIAADRSDERFVFVCAHRVRDERCGYCGPVLVDLLRKALAARHPGVKVHVLPCSHVGGHVYAGNVLVYSKHGGRCFGLIKPEHVDVVADYTAQHTSTSAIPPELAARARGSMTA